MLTKITMNEDDTFHAIVFEMKKALMITGGVRSLGLDYKEREKLKRFQRELYINTRGSSTSMLWE